MPDSKKPESRLVIGWETTPHLQPRFWVSKPKAGQHSADDLVSFSAKQIRNHAIVVAQSGSGKSYLLGRLVEEILLKTKSNVVILDPNSDFKKIEQVIGKGSWKDDNAYDQHSHKPYAGKFLLDEYDRDVFNEKWKNKSIPKIVLSLSHPTNKISISWKRLPVDILAEEEDVGFSNGLRNCHEFVRTINDLFLLTNREDWERQNTIIECAQSLSADTSKNKDSRAQLVTDFEREFYVGNTDYYDGKYASNIRASLVCVKPPAADKLDKTIKYLVDKAAAYRGFFDESVHRFYFSFTRSVSDAGLLGQSAIVGDEPPRLRVFDLPSIDEPRFRLIAVSALLEAEFARCRRNWEEALDKERDQDTRVPTFIVLDEAHNLIPADARNHAERRLQQQFLTIAAEGRKFGLFLILVSQRPDKLDRRVISECANRAVMKVDSATSLEVVRTALGLEAVGPKLQECLKFKTGRALIYGPWSGDKERTLFGAMRRTEEGGRDLWDEYWASPAKETSASPPRKS